MTTATYESDIFTHDYTRPGPWVVAVSFDPSTGTGTISGAGRVVTFALEFLTDGAVHRRGAGSQLACEDHDGRRWGALSIGGAVEEVMGVPDADDIPDEMPWLDPGPADPVRMTPPSQL